MCCRICLVALVALLAGAALAQDKLPPPSAGKAKPADPGAAAAPRDEPKPAPKPDANKSKSADEKALRDALKTLARSLQDGKAEGIKQVIYAANPTERKMVDAMAAMAVEIAAMHRAAVKAFGEEQARGLTGDVVAEMQRIDDAEVSIDGNTATVRYKPAPPADAESASDSTDAARAAPAKSGDGEPAAPPPGPPLVMKKIDGRWQVPMSELSRDATPESIEQHLSDLDAQTKVIAELTKEIAKGKYRNAEKATEAWQSKMMAALTPGNKPPANEKKPDEKKPEDKSKRDRAKADEEKPAGNSDAPTPPDKSR